MASSSGSSYRLDELGWLQFDRLAALVLDAEAGLSDLGWRGDSDIGRVALVGADVVLPHRRITLRGPVSVAVVWVPEDRDGGLRVADFVDRMAGLPIDLDGRLLVLTNLAEPVARKALRNQVGAQFGRIVVMGAREIGLILDRHPGVRAAMPSVLGLRDVGDLIDVDVGRRSSLDVTRAQELARVFWPTRAYDRALGVLTRHRFVVLTGAPEMGKTAIAQMLSLAWMTDGWEAHECNDPEQVWRAFDRERLQLFVADDAFGSTEYRPDAAERWARGLGRLLAMLDDQHWLIWTSRPAPLKAGLRRVQRERGAERFPAPGEVLVDAGDLDLAEKTLILYRHAKDQSPSGPARDLIRSAALTIVEHPHFTPERIRRFVTGRLEQLPTLAGDGPLNLLTAIVQQELASPTDAMRTSFDALEREHQELLISLLDAPAGLIDERELAETVRRHRAGGLSHPPRELIDRLTDHFLRVTPLGIGWVHPSWRDLVIDQLRSAPAARQRFLSACDIDGVTLALSHAGGAAGERMLPLLISDADWDVLADRTHNLLRELDDRDIARILHALTGAVTSVTEGPQASEAQTLATECLDTLKRAWNQRYRPIPLFLLEAWYALSAGIAAPPTAPDLGPTWIELHPGSLLVERPNRPELARAEEWLALADLLSHHEPAALDGFDFYEHDRDLLARAIAPLAGAAGDPDLYDLAESVLKRIEVLLPELGLGTRSAIEIGQLAESLQSNRWWVPEDLAAPPTTEPLTASAFTREDVHRVLSDL